MSRVTLFLLFLVASVWSEDAKVEVFATTMDTKENIVIADGDVVVVYQDYYLSAKKARYDRINGDLELFGSIEASQGGDIKLLGEYAKLNIANKERTFQPFFMLEKKSDVWLSGDKGYAKDTDVEVTSGVMSGCDPNNPLWKMEFTSSEYNTDTMWLHLYNARIYLYDIPVFYTPYFGYSLDTTRRTGVLPPMVGYSTKEGLYYEQSLYIAEQNWWDLELKPQIRTNRGDGLYSTFRFVDSKTSKGSISTGYFKEKQSYFEDSELANSKHYGFNFLYQNDDFINQWFNTTLKGQSGVYADIANMNDVDYINLSTNDTTKNATTTQLLSRVNLFYNEDDDYIGAYLKYYKDLTLESNEKTIQNLPALHYHTYLDTLLKNHLTYSMDIQSNNYYRQMGVGAVQTDFNVPVTLQTSLFDEYLNVAYTSHFYAQHTDFNGENRLQNSSLEYDSGLFARNYHQFSASTRQTRAFETFTHAIEFGTQYQIDGMESQDGYYKEQIELFTPQQRDDYCSFATNALDPEYTARCEFYNIANVKERLQFYFAHYLYDTLGEQILYHRVAQSVSYNKREADEIENELDYQITDNINFYNNMIYNYDENGFSKDFNQISYAGESVDLGLSHMYKDRFTTVSPITSYLTSSINYKYDKHYSYGFRHSYDLETSQKRGFEIGFLYQKRCWDFGLRYVENTRPILNLNGISDSIYDRYIYLTIRLKPIMSPNSNASGFAYRLPDKSENN
ncbi:MAG: LPS-assembly protein LptD [Sulfurimonas sp.]|nr:LPS-assembly protein LptD [Sulfurimonas sp.]